MFAHVLQHTRYISLLLLSTVLAGCGGSGDGGGGASGAPVTGPPNSESISVSTASLAFAATTGAALPARQDLQLTVNRAPPYIAGVAYPPGTPPVSWLNVTASGSSTPLTFHFAVNSTKLSPGTYTTTVGVGIAQTDGTIIEYELISISYVVAGLSAMPNTLSIEYERGQPAPQRLFMIQGSGNWSASADPWISLNTTSGSLPMTIAIGIDPASVEGFAAGDYPGTITFTRMGTGETASVKVLLKVDAGSHRLLVPDDGVALAKTPGLSNLSRTINVKDNFGLVTNWSASANQPWLSVTPSGTTPGALVLTADPTGLTLDRFYNATVSITSPDSTVENTATINVGFWVGSATPTSPSTISGMFTHVVADPVRPYAYAHSGGKDIAVYNVYTGALVRTIAAVADKLGKMTVSSNGSRLFVVDDVRFTLVSINLDSDTRETPWPSGATKAGLSLAYARSNDMGLVFTGKGGVFRADTGVKLAQTFGANIYNDSDIPAASKDGTRLCHVNTGISSYTVTCYPLFYKYSTGGAVFGLPKSGTFNIGGNGSDIALNADGSRVYVAAGAPYEFSAYDAATTELTMPVVQVLPANPYPNSIEIAANGYIFGGTFTPGSSAGYPNVWIYNSAGTQYITFSTNELERGQLAVSGDSLRMITLERTSNVVNLVMRTVP